MTNFNFFLNRQGSRGRQGVKGDKGDNGYSPYIDIKSNTPTEFIMTIHNETESFDTPNLIPTAIGEKVTEMDAVLTTHTEDIANLQGDLTNLSGEVNTLSGEVASNSTDITAIKNKNNAQDSDIAALKTRVGGTEESIEDLNHKYTVLGSEVSDLTLTKQNKLVEGANITLTDNADGTTTISSTGGGGGSDVPIATTQVAGKVKPDGTTITITDDGTISAVGGGSGTGDVTAAGDNRFTGDNTFTGKVNIAGGALTVDGLATLNQTTAQYLNAVNITSSGEINAVSIKANGLRSDDIQTTENKKYLTELDVDNQTIQIVNGKLHANLDELGNEVNNLSSRVTTNEADISAMKTGKQNKLTAGTNVTLTDLTDGTVRIDATGGGGGTGDVTAAGNNTFTGSNTFTSTTTFNAPIAVSSGGSTIETSLNGDTSTNIDLKVNSQADLILGTGTVATQDADGGTHIRDGQIKDTSGNILLSQGNVTAGNNITITKTGKGIQIASSGGGGEAPANMVTTDTDQDITGIKTFKGNASNNDPSIIIGGKRSGLDDVIGGKVGVNGFGQLEISTGAKDDSGLALRMIRNANNTPSYFEFTSNSSDISPVIKLGITNYQGTIKYDTSTYPFGFLFETQNALSGYPYSSFKIADDTLTFKKTDGTVVDLLNNSSKEQYGIRADYALTHGIVDNPNGIISYNATDKVITVHQGLVLSCAGSNSTAKTTISGDMQHTVTSTGDFTLFYANGELLECGQVDYSTEEPTNNGVTNYQAWFNPDKTVNTNQQWQFKSNDTGNVWSYIDNSTPLADIVADSTAITSISYLGYRIFDDDIFAHKSEWVYVNKQLLNNVNRTQEMITVDLSNELPNDGATYDVLFSSQAQPANEKNKFVAVFPSNDKMTTAMRVCQGRVAVAGVDALGYGAFLLPVTSSRSIRFGGSSSANNSGTISLWMHAYKKIG